MLAHVIHCRPHKQQGLPKSFNNFVTKNYPHLKAMEIGVLQLSLYTSACS